MAEVLALDTALIYRRPGARPVTPKVVERLAASLKVIGLRSPIEVRACKRVRNGAEADAFEIITGQHRFEAARKLGWTTIDATVSTEAPWRQRLWEIDENLLHDGGTPAQRAQWHGERESILVENGLASAPGRGGNRQVGDRSYAARAAEAVGQSKRAVERDLARAKKVTPEAMGAIVGTDLDTGTVLDQVAKIAPAKQAAFVAGLKEQAAQPKIAKPALRDEEVIEAQLVALMTAWNKAAPDARQRFLVRIGKAA